MVRKARSALCGMALIVLSAAGPSSPNSMPEWLLGDWTPVDIRQNADIVYPSQGNEPKHWLAGQHLFITPHSLTLADDRCEDPTIEFHHGRPNVPLHQHGGGLLDSFDYPLPDQPIDYLTFNCAHELNKVHTVPNFTADDERKLMKLAFYIIVRSHIAIDMPFFAGAYVKFRKTAPIS